MRAGPHYNKTICFGENGIYLIYKDDSIVIEGKYRVVKEFYESGYDLLYMEKEGFTQNTLIFSANSLSYYPTGLSDAYWHSYVRK